MDGGGAGRGPGAVLSHRSAAALWGRQGTARSTVDVTVRGVLRKRPGVQLHRAQLQPDEVTEHNGIPTTTPPRTLMDLAAVLPKRHLERAVNEAEYLRLADPLSLGVLVARYPRRHGVPKIKQLLEAANLGQARTRSELEDRFLQVLDAANLPR